MEPPSPGGLLIQLDMKGYATSIGSVIRPARLTVDIVKFDTSVVLSFVLQATVTIVGLNLPISIMVF